MHAAWRASGRVAALGYNYIQSPAIRHIGRLLAENAIGPVTQGSSAVRIKTSLAEDSKSMNTCCAK